MQGNGGHSERVVITGASAGVGRATAREFARRGARITLVARGRDGLEAARAEVEALGGEAIIAEADIAIPEEVEAAARAADAAFGGIDTWINNAMVSVFSPVHEMTPSDYARVTEVTYLGTVYGTLAALRRMRPRREGTIVFVGSVLSDRGIPLQSAYCGAKHAIDGFFDSLRSELFHDQAGIRTTMVRLPAVNTPQFSWVKSRLPNEPQPVPPIFQPEVAARAIYWAAHHDRRAITVGGQASVIFWGNKFLPGLGDRYLARTGYSSQQTEEPRDPQRVDNLYAPLPGDAGAHGAFGHRAHARSIQLTLNTHRGISALVLAALGIAAGAALRRLRS
jgi:NAD(P)-dependent dehydrogenase (short-subunit alcohol dehydrogenase family)